MKIVSWNVNGIRAIERKGELEQFLKKYNPEIILFQETKAQETQLKEIIEKYSDYEQHYHSAEKKGYAGTSIWVKKTLPEHRIQRGMSQREDNEGRVLRVDIGNKSIFGVYFPNGGKSECAWNDKLVFYEHFLETINKIKEKQIVIWGGDVNCAHNNIDIERHKENDGKIGFHPKERAWLDKVVKEGWVDVFRNKFPNKVIYSWWNVFTKARLRNVGWRIDYFFINKEHLKQVKNIEYLTEQMGSDHCPVLIEI